MSSFIKRAFTGLYGLIIIEGSVGSYIPSITGYILIESTDIAVLLIFYILGDSYFLNESVIEFNLSLIYKALRD